MAKQPCVYLLASDRNGTLYLGVTSDPVKRIWQHREHAVEGFSDRYDVTRLVWFELHDSMESAIQREKCIKKWRRQWKVELIESGNPYWRDLWSDIIGDEPSSPRPRGSSDFEAPKTLDSRVRGNDEQER